MLPISQHYALTQPICSPHQVPSPWLPSTQSIGSWQLLKRLWRPAAAALRLKTQGDQRPGLPANTHLRPRCEAEVPGPELALYRPRPIPEQPLMGPSSPTVCHPSGRQTVNRSCTEQFQGSQGEQREQRGEENLMALLSTGIPERCQVSGHRASGGSITALTLVSARSHGPDTKASTGLVRLRVSIHKTGMGHHSPLFPSARHCHLLLSPREGKERRVLETSI